MFVAGNAFAEAAAMLEPNGTVLVNQNQVSRVSTVFAGDRVHTGKDSGALISRRGNTVLLAANSALTIGPHNMMLDEGGAAMTLAPNQSAQVGELTLTAAGDAPASYDVQRSCGLVQITVKSGTINVTSGGSTSTLGSGNTKKFKVAKAAECAEGVTNNKTGIVAGVMVGVAAGLIVWFTTGETSHIVP